MTHRAVWNDARLERLRKMWDENIPVPLIADAFGMKPEALRAATRHYGLPRRARGRRASPRLPMGEVAKAAPVLAIVAAPGWPTKAQLMAGR